MNLLVNGQATGDFSQGAEQGLREGTASVQVVLDVDVRASGSILPVIGPPDGQQEQENGVHPYSVRFRHCRHGQTDELSVISFNLCLRFQVTSTLSQVLIYAKAITNLKKG